MKILFFACDPGGAHAIAPIITQLPPKWTATVYARGAALTLFQEIGISFHSLTDLPLRNVLLSENPDVIVTGTSADDTTEKHLWQIARELGIPSFAVLDQWVNYGIRFSKYGLKDIDRYQKEKDVSFLPDKICVMDQFAYTEMCKVGIPATNIIVTGNPHFEAVQAQKHTFSAQKQKTLRDSLEIPDDAFVITFISEPFSIAYPKTAQNQSYWGFDENSILLELLTALEMLATTTPKHITLIVRPHPKELQKDFRAILSRARYPHLRVIIDLSLKSDEAILISNAICGMFSMMLLEAILLDRPVLSIGIGLTKENPCILNTWKTLRTLLTTEELLQNLRECIIDENHSTPPLQLTQHAVQNILDQIKVAVHEKVSN